MRRDDVMASMGGISAETGITSTSQQKRLVGLLKQSEALPRLTDWVKFFLTVGDGQWKLAGTLTLRDVHPTTRKARHPDVAVGVAKELLARINKAAFNHRAKRHGATVASMMILGNNAIGEVTHIHFALGLPPAMNYGEFAALVECVIRKLFWCHQEFDLKPFRDSGWLSYSLAHGTEKLVIECCCKARS